MRILESYFPSTFDDQLVEICHYYRVYGTKYNNHFDLTFYDYNYRLLVYGSEYGNNNYDEKANYADRYLKIIFFIYRRV